MNYQMDMKELLLVTEFKDVLPQLDDIVRSALHDERIPYSTAPQQTVNAGILEIPLLETHIISPKDSNNLRQVQRKKHFCEVAHHKHPLSSPARKGVTTKVKKRRALPYEKLSAVMELDQEEQFSVKKNRCDLCVKCCSEVSKPVSTTSHGRILQNGHNLKNSSSCQKTDELVDTIGSKNRVCLNGALSTGTDCGHTRNGSVASSQGSLSRCSHCCGSSTETSKGISTQTGSSQHLKPAIELTSHVILSSASVTTAAVSMCQEPMTTSTEFKPISYSGKKLQAHDCSRIINDRNSKVKGNSCLQTLSSASGNSNVPSGVSSQISLNGSTSSPGHSNIPSLSGDSSQISWNGSTSSSTCSETFPGDQLLFTDTYHEQCQYSGKTETWHSSHLQEVQKTILEAGHQDEHSSTETEKNKESDGTDGSKLVPVEIGMIGEAEMEKMIQTLVEAQSVFAGMDWREQTLKKEGLSTEGIQYKEAVMNSFMTYFEKKIVETVRFAKRIPGFLDLPRDDQANLIRESRNESDLISSMRSINLQTRSFVSIDGLVYKADDLAHVLSEDTVKIYIEGAEKVEKLDASAEEAALLRAITITFSDRCVLKCKEKVEDIQNRLVSCLLYTVKKGPFPFGVRMGQLFDFLLFCRNVTEICLKNFKNILLKENKFKDHPLITEVL